MERHVVIKKPTLVLSLKKKLKAYSSLKALIIHTHHKVEKVQEQLNTVEIKVFWTFRGLYGKN